MVRATRSSARLSAAGKDAPAKKKEEVKAPPPKKGKKTTKKEEEPEPNVEEEKKEIETKDQDTKEDDEKPAAKKDTEKTSKIVTIEACKQWGAFKTRAAKIQKAVGDKAVVEINKEKPGRGNFVVKVDGKTIVELLAMKRPFPPLKKLDMDEICGKVIDELA